MSRTIATILSLQDKMSPKLVTVSRRVAGMSTEMQRASRQSANMVSKLGKNMMKLGDRIVKTTAKFVALGAIAGAGIILKIGIEGLKELDEASAKVKSIAMADLDKKDIKKGLLKASSKTGIGVQELGDTQYNAISSGVSAKDSLGASLVSAKLAKAGFTDSNSALKVLMATMNVYGLKGNKAMEDIADKMLVVQNLGVITVAEMAESMGSVTPIAQAAGASINELDAGMIALTKNGIKADEAAVELKGMFTSIIAPTKESADMAESLGLEFNAAALKSKGFAKFMEDVKKKTGGNTEKMAGLFGNVRALTGALVLSGPGFKDFNNGLDELKKSSGMTDKAFEIMENTIGAKLDKFKNRFKNTCTSIVDTQSGTLGQIADKMGKWLEDNEGKIEGWVDNIGKTILKIYDAIKKVVDFMIQHRTTIENFIIVFSSFYIATKAVLALSLAIDTLKIAMMLLNGTMVLTPMGWLVILIGSVITAGVLLWKNWDTVKTKADDFCFGLRNAFSNVGTFISNIFKDIANGFIDDLINPMIEKINLLPGMNLKLVEKYEKGTYASLTRPKGDSASRSYDAMAEREKTNSAGANIKKAHSIPQHALGSSYTQSGLALIHEKGGEIRKLSSGETIIPADKSKQLIDRSSKGDVKVYVTIQGNVIGNEEYADYVGNTIVSKVKLALGNM